MPDDIALVVDVLSAALPAVPVSTEVPQNRPQRLIMVALAGDSSTEFVRRPTISLTVWGMSDADAHGLALSAWHAVSEACLEHDLLSYCELETMSRDEWTSTGQSRYLVQLNLTINT